MKQEQWTQWLKEETKKEYFKCILKQVKELNKTAVLSPDETLWFKSLEVQDISKVHTVIIGNRPYCDAYAADGYAFSSMDSADQEMLRLYQKIYQDTQIKYDSSDNSKERWVEQGILLLNLELTRQSGKRGKGTTLWSPFVENILTFLLADSQKRVFIFLDSFDTYKKMTQGVITHSLVLNYDLNSIIPCNKNIFLTASNFVKRYYNYEIDWK